MKARDAYRLHRINVRQAKLRKQLRELDAQAAALTATALMTLGEGEVVQARDLTLVWTTSERKATGYSKVVEYLRTRFADDLAVRAEIERALEEQTTYRVHGALKPIQS